MQLEKDLRIAKARITQLERDEETDARNDLLWPEGNVVHEWWRLSCWHPRTSFDAEDFWLVKKHLKRVGLVGCLKAICGAAYDPYVRELKNGKQKPHNDWDTIFGTKAKAERFMERVPGREGDESTWRKWLIQRIESNLSP